MRVEKRFSINNKFNSIKAEENKSLFQLNSAKTNHIKMFYSGFSNAGLYSPYSNLGYGSCGALGAYGSQWGAHPFAAHQLGAYPFAAQTYGASALGAHPFGASALGAYPYGGYGLL